VIDVGRKLKVRLYDSPGVGDATVKSTEILVRCAELFREEAFSCVLVVIPATETRITVGSRLLQLILSEGLLRAAGNKDIYKRIAIVGTKRDMLQYPEDEDDWKELIATKLLKNKDGKALGCDILTTSVQGRGTEKRPYVADLSQVKNWLCKVPTEILCGQEADPARFSEGLHKILGGEYNAKRFFEEVERLKEEREQYANKWGAITGVVTGLGTMGGLLSSAAAAEGATFMAYVGSCGMAGAAAPVIAGVGVTVGLGLGVKAIMNRRAKLEYTMQDDMKKHYKRKPTETEMKAARAAFGEQQMKNKVEENEGYIDMLDVVGKEHYITVTRCGMKNYNGEYFVEGVQVGKMYYRRKVGSNFCEETIKFMNGRWYMTKDYHRKNRQYFVRSYAVTPPGKGWRSIRKNDRSIPHLELKLVY